MRRRALLVGAAAALLFTGTALAQTLGAVLTGSQEVPPCATSGFGNATVTFDSTRQNITVTITVSNLGSPITGSHIHENPAGVAGNIVIPFTPAASFTNGTLTGTFAVPDSALVQRIRQNPGGFYVNVHTQECPAGAVRGQLSYVGGGPVSYVAELRPQSEVPPATSNAFGSAFVTLDLVNNTVAWEVNSSGVVSPIASHIHRGAAGVAGPVIINFATTAAQIQNGHTKGFGTIEAQQTSVLQPSDLTALANPATAAGYYVNLHSTAFPGGEIRGQLVSATGTPGAAMPSNESDFPVAGHVTNAIGQTFVTDARLFNPSYDTPAVALLEFFPAGTTANTNGTNSIAVNIPPRGTAVLNDVAGASGFNSTSTGAIRVSSASRLAATSRIFTTSNGTFGQFVPLQNRNAAKRRGVMPQLSNTTVATGFRTNIGFFNPTTGTVTLRLELRDSAGTLVAQNTLTLAALSQQQNSIGTYFPGVDISNAANLTLSFDASAPIFSYASVVDNTSGDSILVIAQDDTGVAASQ